MTTNTMREIRIEKITLNVGTGKDQGKLEKATQLLKHITGIAPVKTVTKKRIPEWGLRPGLPIGCKLTLRNPKWYELLKRILLAKDNQLNESNFDENGSISFGLHEYIDIPDVKYNPDIGVMGFEVCITLRRNGFRVKKRRYLRKKLPKKQKISKEEAMEYMKKEYKVQIGEN